MNGDRHSRETSAFQELQENFKTQYWDRLGMVKSPNLPPASLTGRKQGRGGEAG